MRRITRFKKRTWVLLGVGAVAAVAAVGGYAFFTSTGSGSGTGKAGSATNWTVVGGSESANLYPLVYPNGRQALAGGSVTNAGSGYQNLNTIVATIGVPSGGSNLPNACVAADFALSSPAASWVISGASNGIATINPNVNLAPAGVYNMTDLSLSMVDNGANQDGCQGATVNITFNAS
jgi:hypothetical protein